MGRGGADRDYNAINQSQRQNPVTLSVPFAGRTRGQPTLNPPTTASNLEGFKPGVSLLARVADETRGAVSRIDTEAILVVARDGRYVTNRHRLRRGNQTRARSRRGKSAPATRTP